jgi:hypothetical protein
MKPAAGATCIHEPTTICFTYYELHYVLDELQIMRLIKYRNCSLIKNIISDRNRFRIM